MNTDLILINGDIVDRKEGVIEYCDRGHQFGDGVFEIVPVYNGKVFGMIPHMENLFTSVTRLKIPAVYMVEELVEFHEVLIKATGMENGEIYTQITRGSAPFGLAFPEMSVPQLVMQPVFTDRSQLAEAQQKGVKLITEKDLRWQHCDVNTLNRLPEVMARQKAAISGAFDALFVRDGKITETTESSFMLVKDEVLWTAPENENIHKNITRKVIKERLALDLGMPVVEKNFDVDFALKAEEAFICGPRCEIVPVVKIDRKLLNGGEVGKVVPQLLEAYKNFVARECPAR